MRSGWGPRQAAVFPRPEGIGPQPVDLGHMYDEMLPVVYGYCRARLPWHDAEDLTAEVFRVALEHLRADPCAELSRSWFIVTARSRIIDRWRRSARWTERMHLVAASQASTQRPHDEDVGDVVLALDLLPDAQRAAVVLHHVDGFSVEEVAGILNRSPRAAESLLARGRRRLVEALEADGVDVGRPGGLVAGREAAS